MPLQKPDELSFVADPAARQDLEPAGDAAFLIKRREEFGPYLRAQREGRGLSLRGAARELGVPFSYVQRLETNRRAKPPDMPFLAKVAEVFDRPLSEVLTEAGVEVYVPPAHPVPDDVDRAFERLMLHPALKPMRLGSESLDYYSKLQKRQVVQMVLRLEEHLGAGGMPPSVILADQGGDE